MTIGEIFKDGLQVFGFPDAAGAPQKAKDRVLNDINATLQQLAVGGEDFYGREEVAVTLVANTEGYTLGKTVQSVLRPAKLSDGTVLRELTSRGQYLQYGQIFGNGLTNTVAAAKPAVYYVESIRDATDTTGDSVAIVVHVIPKPSSAIAAALTLTLNVIKEPSAVTEAALTAGTAILGIPHKYVESVFLPMLRYNLSRSYLFMDEKNRGGIESDYARALAVLGVADPRKAKLAETNTEALRGGGQRTQ